MIGHTSSTNAARQRRRARVDRWTTRGVLIGGGAVMALIGAIFVYLLSVVVPLFAPATLSGETRLSAWRSADRAPCMLGVEESGEYGVRMSCGGDVVFFAMDDGHLVERSRLDLGAPIIDVIRPDAESDLYLLALADRRIAFVEFEFPVSFAGERRSRGVRIARPFEGSTILLDDYTDAAIVDIAAHLEAGTLSIALLGADGSIELLRFDDAERGLELLQPERATDVADLDGERARRIFLGGQQWLYVLGARGRVEIRDVRFLDDARRVGEASLAVGDVDTVTLLLGGSSLLVPDGEVVSQWLPVRSEDGWSLRRVRTFPLADQIDAILPEARRRGFLTLDAQGGLAIHHSTAERTLLEVPLGIAEPRAIALSARGDLLLVEDADGTLRRWEVANEHPEVSLKALFGIVWYEGYDAPIVSWQSSSASSDGEPKFGLAPLLVGTLKAALYGMCFAVPIAILGAIYTAFFMAPSLRNWIKPSIELMAALPTVILGFLAGLWLAPIVEAQLASVMTLLLVAPLTCLAAGAAMGRAQRPLRQHLPEGWQALAFLPVFLLAGWAAFALGPLLEQWLFEGDLRAWLRVEAGIDYDQRNAIVVGIAMGIAVIPVIFAIAEDSIHSVPTELSHGAIALGATRWQTLLRVVLPAASSGIFSAIMIGFGRAVGETMIVLMASGNTPVLGMDPFSGMRTMAANLAVELPESEVGSTHYRVLFLTALLLFVFTFLINTVGEVIRQRLRERHGHG